MKSSTKTLSAMKAHTKTLLTLTLLTLGGCSAPHTVVHAAPEPSLKFVAFHGNIYTFTAGDTLITATCESTFNWHDSDTDQPTSKSSYCNIGLPPTAFKPKAIGTGPQIGTYFYLSDSDGVIIQKFSPCGSGRLCIDHTEMTAQTTFRIISATLQS